MPPPSFPSSRGRMTANPVRPARYRPGKPVAEEELSSEEEEEEEEMKEQERQTQVQKRPEPPKATSFPGRPAPRSTAPEIRTEEDDEEGFVTEEEEDEEEEGGVKLAQADTRIREQLASATAQKRPTERETQGESPSSEEEEEESEEEESSSEESSSEDERPARMLLRPTFIKKDQRKPVEQTTVTTQTTTEEDAAKEEAARREKADMYIRDEIARAAAERAAARKAWDDDEDNVEGVDEGALDDTDGLDHEAERAAWKVRELKRLKREREAIEVAEKEREEVERRRNLTAEERAKEDEEFIANQRMEKEERGKAGYMQRYFHKGAFYQDDLSKDGLAKRDLMGTSFVDEIKNREALPQYLQVRDATRIGRKGRTRYRDLRSEDTGRWGVDGYNASVGLNNAKRFGITEEVVRQRSPVRLEREREMKSRGSERERERNRDRGGDRSRDRYRPRSRSPGGRSPERGYRRKRDDDVGTERVRRRRRSHSQSPERYRSRRSPSTSRSPERDWDRDDRRYYHRQRSPSPSAIHDREKRRRTGG